jgi:7-carboxy-7-deazaguanine synthase
VNIQPIEKRELRTDGLLSVHSIFYTIQGEGPFCGTPCVFVRLAGCNLQCPACDTDYTSKRRLMTVEDVISQIERLHRSPQPRDRRLVVVTGGEPFRQDLRQLFRELMAEGFYVQVETNGSLQPCVPGMRSTAGWHYSRNPERRHGVYVVCSPKTGKISPNIKDVACAFKYVVRHGQVADDGLPLSALDHPSNPYPARPPQGWDRPVYVQPLDSQDPVENHLHAQEAVASCLRHGYTLQIQIHKLVGVE